MADQKDKKTEEEYDRVRDTDPEDDWDDDDDDYDDDDYDDYDDDDEWDEDLEERSVTLSRLLP